MTSKRLSLDCAKQAWGGRQTRIYFGPLARRLRRKTQSPQTAAVFKALVQLARQSRKGVVIESSAMWQQLRTSHDDKQKPVGEAVHKRELVEQLGKLGCRDMADD